MSTTRPEPTLRDFLVECLYPALVGMARWIARRYDIRPEAWRE